MSLPADLPAQLARFPVDVHEAYRAVITDGDEAAIHRVVRAALLDFLPDRPGVAQERVLDDHARLTDDLGYDSLAIAELVFFFEDLFKVTISSNEIRTVTTVGELHSFVTRKLATIRSSA